MKKPDWKIWLKDKNECHLWLSRYINTKVLRKSTDESKLYLKKADHNLNFANWIFEKHKERAEIFKEETFYDWVIDIYYYAIYHAALAMTSRDGYKSKSHSATLCYLIYYHHHSQKVLNEKDVELIAGFLNKGDIETIGISKEIREKASYDIHESFGEKLAKQIQEEAIDFINKIKTAILK